MNLFELSKSYFPFAQDLRRTLHAIPELGHCEEKTSLQCKKLLEDWGYEIREMAGFGFVADLKINETSSLLAFRADMDALPFDEENNLPFKSTHKGMAHLCGHDLHMSIAIATAKLLSEHRHLLKKNIRFIFQPAEEIPPGGAIEMIKAGALDGVTEIYGLHNDPQTERGIIKTRCGSFTASGDQFNLTIKGKGTHAATPHLGLDPIWAGSKLICDWQSMLGRFFHPLNTQIISVTKFHAGNSNNVIPEAAELGGTIRCFLQEDRLKIKEMMEKSLEQLNSLGYICSFDYLTGYDSIVNSESSVERSLDALKQFAAKEVTFVSNARPYVWGEDFTYYLQKVNGCFFTVGSASLAPLHSPFYDPQEECMIEGIYLFSALGFAL